MPPPADSDAVRDVTEEPPTSHAAAAAAAVQHQLRAPDSHALAAAAAPDRIEQLLHLLHACLPIAAEKVPTSTWQRALRVGAELLRAEAHRHEAAAEAVCAAVVPLAEAVPGAPTGIDTPFALSFLSRLAATPGAVPAAARLSLIHI